MPAQCGWHALRAAPYQIVLRRSASILRFHFMRKGIGIDFGTTNSSIAVARDEHTVETVRFRTGTGTTETYRSVIYFEPKTPGVSGPNAIERYLAADEKGRLIQSLKSFLASRLFNGTSIYGRQFSVEDLITIMLRDLRVQAEEQIGAFSRPRCGWKTGALLECGYRSGQPIRRHSTESCARQGGHRTRNFRIRTSGGSLFL